MGADSFLRAETAARFVGVRLSERQRKLLTQYHDWLGKEGSKAGGIGPGERNRLWDRHIADSIAFGVGLRGATECLDIGSGAGLPGIPLAIAFPDIEFSLVDRSGRRCDLMRRATSVLGLGNCRVEQVDVGAIDRTYPRIVSRAAIPPETMMIHVKRLLESGGNAILGLSRSSESHAEGLEPPPGLTVEVVTVPPEVLDSGAFLLRIEAT